MNGGNKVGRQIGLGYVAGGASRKCFGDELFVFVNGEKDNFGSMIDVPKLRDCLQPIQNGHRYIDHEHVGIEASDFVYRVSSVGDSANNIEVLAQC